MAFNFEGFEYKPVGKTPAQQNQANREHYGQQPGVYTTGSLNHDAFNESEASENTARVNPSVEARVTAAREARQEQRKKDLAKEAEGKKRDAERAERLKAAATNDTDIELLRQELNEFLTEEKQELEHKDFNLIAAQ